MFPLLETQEKSQRKQSRYSIVSHLWMFFIEFQMYQPLAPVVTAVTFSLKIHSYKIKYNCKINQIFLCFRIITVVNEDKEFHDNLLTQYLSD